MSLSRSLFSAASAALIAIALPAAAQAQSGSKTACNDGTTTTATGAKACDGHGGIHKVHTTILHRAPSHTTKSSEPARVSQAGTPTPAPAPNAKPRYEERRGWRWGRRRDEDRREEKRREEKRREEERRRDEKHPDKHARVRCRDGSSDKVVGRGREVCKHHGGVRG